MVKVIHIYHSINEVSQLHIRTVAAIIVWVVVALLLLNRLFMSDLVLPIAIALTIIALLIYFSPKFLKKKTQAINEILPTQAQIPPQLAS